MKRVLLTGATGFIGRNLYENMAGDYELFAPGRKELDLSDRNAVEAYLRGHRFDAVIHCANTSDTNNTATPESSFLTSNLKMFFVLESLSGLYGKMIYFGSGAEYDRTRYIPVMSEDNFGKNVPPAEDSYAFAKYVMAKVAGSSKNIFDLRLFGVFGKYEMWSRRFISNTICRALKGMPIRINNNAVFDYMWVEDLVPTTEWFIENEPRHRHYNVCTGKPTDLLTIARMVCNVLNVPDNIEVVKDGGTEYTGDNSRLRAEMSDVSFTDMRTAIEKLCGYYGDHMDRIDAALL